MEATDDYFDQDWMPYATTDTSSGAIEFSFDDAVEGVDGDGVAIESTYEFLGRPAGSDAEGNYTSMFVAQNQGTSDVLIQQPDDVDSDAEVRVIVEELDPDTFEPTGEINDLVEDQSVFVPKGEAVGLGIRIDTTDVDEPFGETVEIPVRAEETDFDGFSTESDSADSVRGPKPIEPE
ncbi:hypothetical protein [Natronobacterium texcoconense]|uniref:hypothetical protein n=1 Tax=Natronobacterium texcoconense TaxID=1095778 RepID=UPI000B8A5F8A|nr:hypothetical protein [Natronobacterium texcoconense]